MIFLSFSFYIYVGSFGQCLYFDYFALEFSSLCGIKRSLQLEILQQYYKEAYLNGVLMIFIYTLKDLNAL